ncbi:MAG: hypothetical protein IT280_08810 [Ignavibacteria bacterium]|nr:hypothetical protein [Ignavibacteria bacterium]
MVISKILHFFKSFRNRTIFAISLLIIAAILLISKFILNNENSDSPSEKKETKDVNIQEQKLSKEQISILLSPGIDSVLHNFGLTDEWITTFQTDKNIKASSTKKETELFVKNVLIPTDLTSIEVNADINSYITSLGLTSQVNEDITTKDITIQITNTDTLTGSLPLAKINIEHSDKVSRESAQICIIINNINEYTPEEIDNLLLSKNEFSFVFPRNLDDINLQNKLLHGKKDVIINLTIGNKDNYETDFNASMDDKAILERVKNFTVDFPTVTTVLLSLKDQDIPAKTINSVTLQLTNYKIRILPESSLTVLLTAAEKDSKDKFNMMAKNIITKGKLAKSIVSTVNVTSEDFTGFYDKILYLKKLGYKFCNYSEYVSRKDALEKQQKEKEEKLKEQKLKEQKQKEEEKKNKVKKTDLKKSNIKNSTNNKPGTKKKTDVKKK